MLDKILVKEVIGPVFVIVFFSFIYIIIKSIIKKIMQFRLTKVDERRKKMIMNLLLNIAKCFFIVIAILMILSIYGINTSAIITSLGVVGVVVGLAFQDILKDLLSGISIIIENQYGLGDTVTIGGFKGEVIYLGLRTTRIKSYTGEVQIIANRNIQEIINYSISNSRAIVDINVSYDENLEKVEKVLNEVCELLTKELKSVQGKIKVLGINELKDSSIEYRIIADTKPMEHLDVQRKMLKEIKKAFDKNKIEIPYNQMVIYNA